MGAGWRTSSGDGNGEQGNYNLEWNPRPLQRSKGVGGGELVPGQPGLYFRHTLWQKGGMLTVTYEPKEDKGWCQD